MSTFERLNALLGELGCNEAKSPEQEFINDLGLDSLDCVDLVMDVEQAFGICIDDDEFSDGKVKTVQQAVDLIDSLVASSKEK